MHAVERRHWVLLAVAIGGVSFSAILARMAQAEGVPSLVISFYRLLFATLMLAPFAVRAAPREPPFSVRELGVLALIGLFLAAHFATWITSLELTSVASSVVIVTTESLWVPLGAAYILREHVGVRMWAGILIAFAGSILLVSGDAGEVRFGGNALVGDALAFAAALAASMYFLAGRRFRQRRSLPVYAVVVYGFSTVFLLLMSLAQGASLGPYSTRAYGILFLFAFFPMIVGHTLINYLLRWVPPHYISTSILAEPVVSALLALAIWGETIRALVLVGGVAILVGIYIGVSARPEPSAAADPGTPT